MSRSFVLPSLINFVKRERIIHSPSYGLKKEKLFLINFFQPKQFLSVYFGSQKKKIKNKDTLQAWRRLYTMQTHCRKHFQHFLNMQIMCFYNSFHKIFFCFWLQIKKTPEQIFQDIIHSFIHQLFKLCRVSSFLFQVFSSFFQFRFIEKKTTKFSQLLADFFFKKFLSNCKSIIKMFPRRFNLMLEKL